MRTRASPARTPSTWSPSTAAVRADFRYERGWHGQLLAGSRCPWRPLLGAVDRGLLSVPSSAHRCLPLRSRPLPRVLSRLREPELWPRQLWWVLRQLRADGLLPQRLLLQRRPDVYVHLARWQCGVWGVLRKILICLGFWLVVTDGGMGFVFMVVSCAGNNARCVLHCVFLNNNNTIFLNDNTTNPPGRAHRLQARLRWSRVRQRWLRWLLWHPQRPVR
jgi:hypothetical protein